MQDRDIVHAHLTDCRITPVENSEFILFTAPAWELRLTVSEEVDGRRFKFFVQTPSEHHTISLYAEDRAYIMELYYKWLVHKAIAHM